MRMVILYPVMKITMSKCKGKTRIRLVVGFLALTLEWPIITAQAVA